jgi:3-dehydroquinate synthase
VHLGAWLLAESGALITAAAPAHVYAIVSDTNAGPVAGPLVVGSLRRAAPASRILYREIEPGERFKTRESWQSLTDWLLEERCGRDTTMIALGGGVVGDLAGFVAATLLRGVPVVQIPTTLLAMVDASVGGKVAVDTAHGKNLVGAFHQPACVLVDPTVLQTLPSRELRAGYAEILKHGIIADAGYFDTARAQVPHFLGNADQVEWSGEDLASLIQRSVELKAAVVREDERENGLRRILNFGHTIGHAVETASGFRLLHGEALAIGMALEATLAESLGVAASGTASAIVDALREAGLPSTLPPDLDVVRLIDTMLNDKKRQAGLVMLALPASIGRMAGADSGFVIPVERDRIERLLRPAGGA